MKPTIRSSALSCYPELAHSLGLDPLVMIRDVGLLSGCFLQVNLMLNVNSVCELLELSAERSGLITFGLALSKYRRLSDLGELGLVMRDQPTLGHLVKVIESFSSLHNEALFSMTEEDGQYTNIYLETKIDSDILIRQFCEFLLGSTFKICKAMFGVASKEIQVCFRHGPPPDLQQHIKFFGNAPLFNFDFNGFIYKSSLLNEINMNADPNFAQYTLGLIKATRNPTSSSSYTDKVWRVAVQLLPRGQCSAEQVAVYLGMDRRTVHRKLMLENQNFSSIIDQVKQEMAARHVLESNLPIAEIAPLLGFRSASALVTWYRRHFGLSPMQHRRQSTVQA